jgi:hypothetical protein
MTKQEFLELYGKSVYQVRLEVASHLWCQDSDKAPHYRLQDADTFIKALLAEDAKQLRQSYD